MKRLLLPLLLAAGLVAAAFASSTAPAKSKDELLTIGRGQPVKLADYAVAGKTTIFDFMSPYCPPCRALEPALHKLTQDRKDVVVIEVDINRPGVSGIDWSSPLARQYSIELTPQFKVYGPDKKLKSEGDEAHDFVFGLLQ